MYTNITIIIYYIISPYYGKKNNDRFDGVNYNKRDEWNSLFTVRDHKHFYVCKVT